MAKSLKPCSKLVENKWRNFVLGKFASTKNCEQSTVCHLSKATAPNLKSGSEPPCCDFKKKDKKKCPSCFQELGKGLRHNCSIENRHKLLERAIVSSVEIRKIIASNVISSKITQKGKPGVYIVYPIGARILGGFMEYFPMSLTISYLFFYWIR